MHTYMPDKIPFESLKPGDRNGNCARAARAAKLAGAHLNFDLEAYIFGRDVWFD